MVIGIEGRDIKEQACAASERQAGGASPIRPPYPAAQNPAGPWSPSSIPRRPIAASAPRTRISEAIARSMMESASACQSWRLSPARRQRQRDCHGRRRPHPDAGTPSASVIPGECAAILAARSGKAPGRRGAPAHRQDVHRLGIVDASSPSLSEGPRDASGAALLSRQSSSMDNARPLGQRAAAHDSSAVWAATGNR